MAISARLYATDSSPTCAGAPNLLSIASRPSITIRLKISLRASDQRSVMQRFTRASPDLPLCV